VFPGAHEWMLAGYRSHAAVLERNRVRALEQEGLQETDRLRAASGLNGVHELDVSATQMLLYEEVLHRDRRNQIRATLQAVRDVLVVRPLALSFDEGGEVVVDVSVLDAAADRLERSGGGLLLIADLMH